LMMIQTIIGYVDLIRSVVLGEGSSSAPLPSGFRRP
jgi:hypothetical protein